MGESAAGPPDRGSHRFIISVCPDIILPIRCPHTRERECPVIYVILALLARRLIYLYVFLPSLSCTHT